MSNCQRRLPGHFNLLQCLVPILCLVALLVAHHWTLQEVFVCCFTTVIMPFNCLSCLSNISATFYSQFSLAWPDNIYFLAIFLLDHHETYATLHLAFIYFIFFFLAGAYVNFLCILSASWLIVILNTSWIALLTPVVMETYNYTMGPPVETWTYSTNITSYDFLALFSSGLQITVLIMHSQSPDFH